MGWSALRFYLCRWLSKVGEDEMFGPVLGPGLDLEHQNRVVENTVTTDANGREGRGFDLAPHFVLQTINLG